MQDCCTYHQEEVGDGAHERLYMPKWEVLRALCTTTRSGERTQLSVPKYGLTMGILCEKIHNLHALKRPSFQQD